MPSKAYARVELRGLTFSGKVWSEGDEVALSDLPASLRRQVKAGEHPHLTVVKAGKAMAAADEPDEEAAATAT